MDKRQYITISCPICKNVIGGHNPDTTTNSIYRCRKCNKRVVYHIDSEKITIKNFPSKITSSGVSFV